MIVAQLAGAARIWRVLRPRNQHRLQTAPQSSINTASVSFLANDAVAGSRNDAAVRFVNQAGAVGWGTLIQIGDALNANPLTAAGSILAIKGSPTITNGIDLSGAASITGYAFRTSSGKINIASPAGTPNVNFLFAVQLTDATFPNPGQYLFGGDSKEVRLWQNAIGTVIDRIGDTGVAIPAADDRRQRPPLSNGWGGSEFNCGEWRIFGRHTRDPGADDLVNNASFLIRTATSFANGGGGGSSPTWERTVQGPPANEMDFHRR